MMTEAESRNVVGVEQVAATRVNEAASATLVIEQIADILMIGIKTEVKFFFH